MSHDRMKTAVALLVLLLCLYGAVSGEGDSEGGEEQADAGATGTDDQTRPSADILKRLITRMKGLETRLATSEKKVDDLEKKVDDLEKVDEGLETRLDDLEKVDEDRRNAAFSAAMNDEVSTYGTIEEEATAKQLIYDEVTYNTGDYDSTTGVFTAPRDGLYFFRVTARYTSRISHLYPVYLCRCPSVCSSCLAKITFDSEHEIIVSGLFHYGVHLTMKQGEKVYVTLPAHSGVLHSTFSGHLLATYLLEAE